MNIVRGHALDLVGDIPECDLLVTDPPYAFGGDGAEHAMSATVATVLRESAQRLRKTGWAVVFAASSWRSTYYMIEAVRGVLEPVRVGTWVKPASRSKVRTPGWAWASVNAIVMRRIGAKGQHGQPVPLLDWICEPPLMDGRRAQLPPAVAEWAVEPFALSGGLAFDPFAGSGALLAAAAGAGMETLGFEIEHSDAGYVPPSPIEWSPVTTAEQRASAVRAVMQATRISEEEAEAAVQALAFDGWMPWHDTDENGDPFGDPYAA